MPPLMVLTQGTEAQSGPVAVRGGEELDGARARVEYIDEHLLEKQSLYRLERPALAASQTATTAQPRHSADYLDHLPG